jgi:dephospho-CoA kinase
MQAEPTSRERGSDRRSKPVLGILGGIGSGKSTVAAALEKRGARRIDADRIAHALLEEPEVRERVRAAVGDEVLGEDGAVDRGRLGRLVFESRDALREIEAILHPRVLERMEEEVEEARRDPTVRFIVVDAPLLLESGLERRCDVLVFVEASEETRFLRVKQTRGWDLAELRRREKFQKPLNEKKGHADYVIENDRSARSLEDRVEKLCNEILASRRPIP